MRTRTKGIQLLDDSERLADKLYRGQRIFERLGRVSQEEAEAWLRTRQAEIDAERNNRLRQGGEQLFAAAAQKYLIECQEHGDVRSLDTIAGHVLLLNEWIGLIPLRALSNYSFAPFKTGRLRGRTVAGRPARKVKPTTVNRSLEVARTVLNRAARVWRTDDCQPWLSSPPLIEMLDESETKRKPHPIS